MPPKRRGRGVQKKVVKPPTPTKQQQPQPAPPQPPQIQESSVESHDLSDLLVLASAGKNIVDTKPALNALNLLGLYNKVPIQNTIHGSQINIEGIQITVNKGDLIAHFNEGRSEGYMMGSKFPMLWLKELQQLRREIIKRQFLEKAEPDMHRISKLFGLTPLTPINIIGDGICRTFNSTELTKPNDPLSGTIVLSFYRKAQQIVAYLRTASCQYELSMNDDESLKKSFQEFIAKNK
jgi:hypothetical protein